MIAHNDNLPIHEDKTRGVYVKDLLEVYVSSIPEVYEVMRRGGTARMVASTSNQLPLHNANMHRHERRILPIPFHLCPHHLSKEHRNWLHPLRPTLPRRSRRVRKSGKNRSHRPNPRRSQ